MSRIDTPMVREAVEIEPRRTISLAVVLRVRKGQKDTCALCPIYIGPGFNGFHVDHIIPLALGGRHNASNFQCICVPCHKTKTKADVKAIAKAKRLAGETGNGPKRPIRSRGFDKGRTRRFDGSVVERAK